MVVVVVVVVEVVVVLVVVVVDVVASVMSLRKKQAQVQIHLKCLEKRPVVNSCIIGVDKRTKLLEN
jgi:hypothetical protein